MTITRGFEYVGRIDGKSDPPMVRDFPVDGTAAVKVGDLMLLNSDGQLAPVTTSTGEVTAVMQEARESGADGDMMKAAVIVREQVWKCTSDGTAAMGEIGYTKTLDTADERTLNNSGTAGSFILWDSETDESGTVTAHVIFSDTTFGNT